MKGSRCHAGCTNTNPETKMHNAQARHTHKAHTQGMHTHVSTLKTQSFIIIFVCIVSLAQKKSQLFSRCRRRRRLRRWRKRMLSLSFVRFCVSSARYGSTLSKSKGGGNGLRGQCAVPFLGVVSGPHHNTPHTPPTHTQTHIHSKGGSSLTLNN